MAEYRDRTSGEIKTKDQLKRDKPNMSMPKVWNEFTFDALNVDPVLNGKKPTDGIGQYQFVARNGVVQDASSNWVEAYEIRDMFADDSELGTKAEQEVEYQTQLDTNAASNNRSQRDRLLQETDWWASSDLTMSAEQTAYRQSLRDITTHSNWPHLENSDWPTEL